MLQRRSVLVATEQLLSPTLLISMNSALMSRPCKDESDSCSMAQMGYTFQQKVDVLIHFNDSKMLVVFLNWKTPITAIALS